MKAYCCSSGRIGFGGYQPEGALAIARGSPKALQAFIARHATRLPNPRKARVARAPDKYVVPGMAEAPDFIAAVLELETWLGRLSVNPPVGVTVATGRHVRTAAAMKIISYSARPFEELRELELRAAAVPATIPAAQ
jgi:hypothetical protein